MHARNVKYVILIYCSVCVVNTIFYVFHHFLEYSSENLRCCLIIIIAHMLLAPELVMNTQGQHLMVICDSLMADLRFDGILLLTRLVETFIRASPVLGSETVKPILPRIFQ